MRFLLLPTLALAMSFAPLQPSFAQAAAAPQAAHSHAATQPSGLLQRLGIGLIPKARAAECTREGETCTSNEQCCPGLECGGGPPATCLTEE
jgi:hypothetical protein